MTSFRKKGKLNVTLTDYNRSIKLKNVYLKHTVLFWQDDILHFKYFDFILSALTFKKYHFGPLKNYVFGFWRKPPQKNLFFVFRFWFSFKNNRRTNVLLVGIFKNVHTKFIDCQKRHFGCFGDNNVFCAYSKILIKVTFVCLLF